MGMNLSRPGGDFWWDVFSWHKLLRIAESCGWKPAGTALGEEELRGMPNGLWSGGYTSNDFQVVSAEDAEGLAAALERAMRTIPDADVLAPHRGESGGIVIAPNGPQVEDTDWFGGLENKERIRQFIRYCRTGEFSIG